MAKQTQQMPVLRTQAQFTWAPPTPPSAPTEFSAGLYSDGTVELDAPRPLQGVVTGLEWLEGEAAIKGSGGSWSRDCAWDDRTRQHLLMKATNALRRQMKLPPHDATAEWPGSE